MRVLIVQSNAALSDIWGRHLRRLGATVTRAETGSAAMAAMQTDRFDVIVLDLVLREGSALSIADFANFNMPRANVVFVTDTTFFSDGSIFVHSANARAFVESNTAPNDLAEIVHYYGDRSVNPPRPRVPMDQSMSKRSMI